MAPLDQAAPGRRASIGETWDSSVEKSLDTPRAPLYYHFNVSRNEEVKGVVTQESQRLDVGAMFKALGDPTRLHIFEFLRSCRGPVAVEETGAVRPIVGPTVGEVCCHVTGAEQINSKISHHLKELRLAGLITVERRGKNMLCGVNHDAVKALASYLGREVTDANGSTCCC